MSEQKRLVTVTAVVMTEETPGPEDVAASFEAVAEKLAELARRRRAGYTRSVVPIYFPLLQFEATSEPRDGTVWCARCGHVLTDRDADGWYYQVLVSEAKMPGFTFADRVHQCDGRPHAACFREAR